jgi:hypothetical protein
MSAPQPQVLDSVQQLANWFARLLGRGEAPNPETPTYQRLTQGLSAGEIGQALDYAQRAETLRQELLAAAPGTQLYQLPGYAELGTVPVVNVLRVYAQGDAADALRVAGARSAPGTLLASLEAQAGERLPKGAEYREDFYYGGSYFSLGFAGEQITGEEAEGFGPDASSDYVGMTVGSVLPFNLYG